MKTTPDPMKTTPDPSRKVKNLLEVLCVITKREREKKKEICLIFLK